VSKPSTTAGPAMNRSLLRNFIGELLVSLF
jgi:hypothetical protein